MWGQQPLPSRSQPLHSAAQRLAGVGASRAPPGALTTQAVQCSRPWLRVHMLAPLLAPRRGPAHARLENPTCPSAPGRGARVRGAGGLCPSLSMHTDVFEVSLGFCGNFAFLVLLLVSLVTLKTNTHSCVTGSPSDFSDRLLGLGTRQNVGSRNPNRASPLQSRLPAPRTKGHGALLRPGRPGPGPSGATSGQAFLLTTLAMFVEEHQAHSVCVPSACHPEPPTAGTGGACPVLRVPVSGNHRTWVLTTHRSLTPFASS